MFGCRQLIGSREVALEVVRLLREVVTGARFTSIEQLLQHLRQIGDKLQRAGPKGEWGMIGPLSSRPLRRQLLLELNR